MKKEDVNLALYQEGMSALARSGVFEVIRELGQVSPIPDGPNYAERHIAVANQSIGYMIGLNNLLFFKERFLLESVPEAPRMDYGGTEMLIANKIITAEEAKCL